MKYRKKPVVIEAVQITKRMDILEPMMEERDIDWSDGTQQCF